MKKSRKQRKLEAKQNGVPFVPQYNGNGVISYEEYYGLGNNRFNNKFVQFDKKVEETVDIQKPIEIDDGELLELVEAELESTVEEAPKKKKGKLKKAFKKLFGK